ncbi:hypothetical protein [Muricoccus aerilatus]|uniref:hypothetical protein n=1 Tax=Muricoccus aerilatus TaxID=452982 RepID=UPI0005C1DE30|nr:hypothetical protein [Roseomonas aerilata]
MPVIYVLDVPEFMPVVEAARGKPECQITHSDKGYWRVESASEIVLNRREMGLKPAVWYGSFTGGLDGEITEFGREEVRVIGTNRPL